MTTRTLEAFDFGERYEGLDREQTRAPGFLDLRNEWMQVRNLVVLSANHLEPIRDGDVSRSHGILHFEPPRESIRLRGAIAMQTIEHDWCQDLCETESTQVRTRTEDVAPCRESGNAQQQSVFVGQVSFGAVTFRDAR
jgi:hypothetical protein